MPRGRPKKTNKLTNAECCRRSRKKRKKEDPDRYKTKSAAYTKKHYNKNKNTTQFRLKTQISSLLRYYKKEQKKKPFLKVITASKDVNTSWGVELDYNSVERYRLIKPSISQVCNIPKLTQPHYIIWMMTKNEKCAGSNLQSLFKLKDMLKENQITMVLTEAKPERIPYAPTTLKLKKNKDKEWDVLLDWDPVLKRVLIKRTDKSNFICIIGLSVQGNWWFATNEGKKDYNAIKTMFSNFNNIYIYGNPVSENEIESTDETKWSEVDECRDDSVEESKFDKDYVPLDGTDIFNITEDLQKLDVPCYCFYNKPMKFDELESRAEKYEVLKVIKNVGLECQVRIKYTEWNNEYEQDVDVKDIDFFHKLGREEMLKKSLREHKPVERYNPEEEDIKQQEHKAILKSVKNDNEKLKRDIVNAKTICEIQFTQRTEFGCLMSSIKDCTVVKHTSSTNSGAWMDVNAEKLFVDLLKSTIPQAYVDITYDFFMNALPKGVFKNEISNGEILGSSYSHCEGIGSEKVTVVSFDIFIDCLYVSSD